MGAPSVETVRFAVGGTKYEIDLNKKNAAAFRRKLAPFIEHARRAGRGVRPRADGAVLLSGRGRPGVSHDAGFGSTNGPGSGVG